MINNFIHCFEVCLFYDKLWQTILFVIMSLIQAECIHPFTHSRRTDLNNQNFNQHVNVRNFQVRIKTLKVLRQRS